MRPLVLILLLSIFTLSSTKACSCLSIFHWNHPSDFDEYTFIALVKITAIQDIPNDTNTWQGKAILTLKIIEQFKGNKTSTIIDYEKYQPCGQEIKIGEQWILYGIEENGELFVRPCDRNSLLKKRYGFKDYHYDGTKDDLTKLRKVFPHPNFSIRKPIRTLSYKDGQLALKESYHHGKLNGERLLWYSDGTLQCRQFYTNGVLDGKSEWFYTSGQLRQEEYFKNGLHCNVSKFYYDTMVNQLIKDFLLKEYYKTEDELYTAYHRIQVENEKVYDADGQESINRMYLRDGAIYAEEITDKETGVKSVKRIK